jgi:broad specificity phosphatase PhoE
MCGWSDLPADLSDKAALDRLSKALPWAPVVSSDLRRAVATADAIAGMRPRLRHEPDLREMNFGAWEMRTHADVAQENEALARALWEAPGDPAPPGGESWNALRARVLSALDQLHLSGDLIVVCHFGPILAAFQRAAGVRTVDAFSQRIDPLSLTVLAGDDGAWRVEACNQRL